MKRLRKFISLLRLLTTPVLLIVLVACQRGQLPETANYRSSWPTPTTGGTGTTVPTWPGGGGGGGGGGIEPLLHCSPFNEKNMVFSGHIASLDNGSGGIDEKRVGIVVAAYPAPFLETGDTYIEIFRWRVPSASGSPIVDNTGLLLELVHLPTGQSAAINLGRQIRFDKGAIARAATRIGVENKPYDFGILVNGTTSEWQALMVTVRQGTSSLGVTQVLLPGFLANPNAYAAYRPKLLADLHPLRSKTSEPWSSEDFRIAGETLCRAPQTMAHRGMKKRYIASEGRDPLTHSEQFPSEVPSNSRSIASQESQTDPWLTALTAVLLLGLTIAVLKRKKSV